jgi:polysaccharide export outer membrane protein
VIGEAATKVPLRSDERVLDVVARAGGTKFPGHELYVTLVRKGKSATVYFPRLIRDPRENVYMAPGDILYIYREQQRFVAIGAFGAGGGTGGQHASALRSGHNVMPLTLQQEVSLEHEHD